MQPLFTIIVPTRDRADTLGPCLNTLLRQDFDSYEILVMDNNSDGRTTQVIRAAAAQAPAGRIQHHRGPPVSMRANWERALDVARGEYLLFLGDDDGLTGQALAVAAACLDQAPVKILRSATATYFWPNWHHAGARGSASQLLYFWRSTRLYRAGDLLPFLSGELVLDRAPSIYDSFVHRSIIDQYRTRFGHYFLGFIPDDCSALQNLLLNELVTDVGYPLVIRGSSGHSTGGLAATVSVAAIASMMQEEVPALDEFLDFGIPAEQLPFLSYWTAISRLQTIRKLFETVPGDWFGPTLFFVLNGVKQAVARAPQHRPQAQALIAAASSRYNLRLPADFLDPNAPMPSALEPGFTRIDDGARLVCDLSAFGVEDVDGAAAFLGPMMPGRLEHYHQGLSRLYADLTR